MNGWIEKIRWTAFLGLALTCAAAVRAGHAQNAPANEATANEVHVSGEAALERLDACRHETDPHKRLQCFDTLFATPDRVAISVPRDPSGPSPARPWGKIERLAHYLENKRTVGHGGWLRFLKMWNSEAVTRLTADGVLDRLPGGTNNPPPVEEVDYFITRPSMKGSGGRTILMLSCENNITTLHLITSTTYREKRIPARFRFPDSRAPQVILQDIENGRVLITGRGLESIGFLRQMMQYPHVDIIIDEHAPVRFDTTNLADTLKPLRAACHW